MFCYLSKNISLNLSLQWYTQSLFNVLRLLAWLLVFLLFHVSHQEYSPSAVYHFHILWVKDPTEREQEIRSMENIFIHYVIK